ncbi:hypothetical protein P691DRAFT_809691 [Macrolepiota fuliginosa MF-IS2]|uniref:Uncharacterized protein n=1 Tax=Macrolepiota fuliginosa MF-IS2 TaxID=1400762 RepID=A0A9P6BYX4_9AGAR|nr:hypothetical protein P691DRAFT_809691 [Macrolepiota fuliginosa MF-IS2]
MISGGGTGNRSRRATDQPSVRSLRFSTRSRGQWLLVLDMEGMGRVLVYDLEGGVEHLIELLHKPDASRTLLMTVGIDRSEDSDLQLGFDNEYRA